MNKKEDQVDINDPEFQEEIKYLVKYYSDRNIKVTEKDVTRKLYLDIKYANAKAGTFTEVTRIKVLIKDYNHVIKHYEGTVDLDRDELQGIITRRDALINQLVTEYLKLGVPNDLLPEKEGLKK